MNTDVAVTAIADCDLPVMPNEDDTASGRDEAGDVFLWKYRQGLWTKMGKWSEKSATECVGVADQLVIYTPTDELPLAVLIASDTVYRTH